MNFFKIIQSAVATISKRFQKGMNHRLKFKGVFNVECRDSNGNIKWVEVIRNGVTTPGINAILDAYFRTGTNSQPFNIGLIDSTSYSGVSSADTMSAHSTWLENTSYSQATRPVWGPAAAATNAIANSSPAVFSINATATLKGIFCVGGTTPGTKNGTTGTLWATALFGSDQAIANGDTLNITYTVSAA